MEGTISNSEEALLEQVKELEDEELAIGIYLLWFVRVIFFFVV